MFLFELCFEKSKRKCAQCDPILSVLDPQALVVVSVGHDIYINENEATKVKYGACHPSSFHPATSRVSVDPGPFSLFQAARNL